ncbi:MAG: T9SS C-terminal target domain-containing protein [Balneolaceae bacterium]|nr:MAG: T9SS C-terminal target domain-containing protein [Balneolaceae bacterium]
MSDYSLKRFLPVLFLLFTSVTLQAQQHIVDQVRVIEPAQLEEICTLEPLDHDANFYFRPFDMAAKPRSATGGATFDITYLNNCDGAEWPEEAKAAFEYAIDLWSAHLSSEIPIGISANWRALGGNTLGSAGPTRVVSFTSGSGIIPGTWYPIAQASAIAGVDYKQQFGVEYDITVNMNCEFRDWYYGTDAVTPGGLIDMVTVLLHEIGHGIGFVGTVGPSPSTGAGTADWGLRAFVNAPLLPIIYDRFALDGDFENLIDTEIYPNPSTLLYSAVTGQRGGVFFGSVDAEGALANRRIPLYAPNPFQGGSSFSHLDQNYFHPDSTKGGSGQNALMRPQIPRAFAVHSPGPVFCGMLKGMGWPLGPACEFLIRDSGPLPIPRLALPANGVKNQNRTPELAWDAVAGAQEYRIQVSKEFTHTFATIDEIVTETTFEIPQNLDFQTLYFWRVRAVGASGNSSWSPNYRFTTAIGIPDAVTLLAPANGSTNLRPAVDLQWEPISGVTSYRLQVATDPQFSNRVIDRDLTISQFNASQLLDFSTTYYWRVRATGPAGTTEWSPVWEFTTIIERPETVVLSTTGNTPADGATQVPVGTSFTWEPSARAAEFTIQISDDRTFTTVSVEGSASEAIFTPSSPLEFAKIYYWRVKASNIGGESGWSAPAGFTTEVRETLVSANYPNPFNASTTLRYQLSDQRDVLVDVYDMAGRRVAVMVNQQQAPGVYFLQMNANNFASGTYLVRFIAGDVMDVQRMAVIK